MTTASLVDKFLKSLLQEVEAKAREYPEHKKKLVTIQESDNGHKLMIPTLSQHFRFYREKKQERPELKTEDGDCGQLYVLRQRKNDSCGYYCLYNALLFLSAIRAPSEEILHKLHDRALFWRYLNYWKTLIFQHAATLPATDMYPWSKNIIASGVLERTFINYLLKHEDFFKLLKGRSDLGLSNLPDLSSYYLRNNTLDEKSMTELERVFEIFATRPTYAHAFTLGQMVHWVTVVINKVDGFVETVLFDSRNIFTIGATEEEVWYVINNRCKRRGRLRYFGTHGIIDYKVPQYRLDQWFHSTFDVVWSVTKLHQWAKGLSKVRADLLLHFLEGFFNLFYKIVRRPVKGQEGSATKGEGEGQDVPATEQKEEVDEFEGLCQWLAEYYPPAVLEETFLDRLAAFGVTNLPEQAKCSVKDWQLDVKRILGLKEWREGDHAQTLTRLEEVLSKIEASLERS